VKAATAMLEMLKNSHFMDRWRVDSKPPS